MIAIHDTHRKLADLYLQYIKGTLTHLQGAELLEFFKRNYELVHRVDSYKEAAYTAQVLGDMDLVQYFVQKLDELEVQCL